MPQSKLYDFLRELHDKPDKLAQFEQDANKAMEASGLSEEEQDLVRSGDEERIMRHLGIQDKALGLLRIRNIMFGV